MNAYKVVRKNGENIYRSAIDRSEFLGGRYDLEYSIGRKTLPVKGTKLFVFTELLFAEQFLSVLWGKETYWILEGDAEGIEKFSWISKKTDSISRFWKVKHFVKAYCATVSPSGTFIASSFTPTKVV